MPRMLGCTQTRIQRAVEMTEESEGHILSTLAAGYAESGDFENAVKWSEKAVEAAKKELEEGASEESAHDAHAQQCLFPLLGQPKSHRVFP